MIVRFRDKEYAVENGGLSFGDFLKGVGAFDERLVAVRSDGRLLDLSSRLAEGSLDPIYLDSAEGLQILRHSTAHVMAQAVKELFPGQE